MVKRGTKSFSLAASAAGRAFPLLLGLLLAAAGGLSPARLLVVVKPKEELDFCRPGFLAKVAPGCLSLVWLAN